MTTTNNISWLRSLRPLLGLLVAFVVSVSQFTATAVPLPQADIVQQADEDQDTPHSTAEEIAIIKASEVASPSTGGISLDIDRPQWKQGDLLSDNPVVFHEYEAIPLNEQHYFRTLLREIISPNAP